MLNNILSKIFNNNESLGEKLFNNNEYEYAGFFVRFAARIIDSILLWFTAPLAFVLALIVNGFFKIGVFDNLFFDFSIYGLCYFVVKSFYFCLFHHFCGQTPGKKIFGLKVIDKDGENLSFGMALYREMVGMLLIEKLYYLPSLLMLFTKQHISLGDYFVDSRVVKTEPTVVKKNCLTNS